MACPKCHSVSHPSANLCPLEGKTYKDVKVAPGGLSDRETERQLKWYTKAKMEGIQPWGTTVDPHTGYLQSEVAMAISDKTGIPYQANNVIESVYPGASEALRPLSQEEKERERAQFVPPDS